MIDILIAAAFPPELEAFGLPLDQVSEFGARSIRLSAVGVGPLAAASGTARLLASQPARLVLFVGTAGVFPHAVGRFPVGSAAHGRATNLVDVATLRGWSERPAVQSSHFVLARLPFDPKALTASVATTTAVTVDDSVALEIERAGFDLENLELAGVAAACAATNHPCSSVLGVSNVVGKNGRSEWLANHLAASRAVAKTILGWLDWVEPR